MTRPGKNPHWDCGDRNKVCRSRGGHLPTRDRDRETETERKRQAETERQRQKDRERDRVRDRETKTERQRQRDRDRETETERQRQRDRETDAERQTQRDRDRETEREGQGSADPTEVSARGLNPLSRFRSHCCSKAVKSGHFLITVCTDFVCQTLFSSTFSLQFALTLSVRY